MRRPSAPGTVPEQILAYTGCVLCVLIAIDSTRRGLEDHLDAGWGLAAVAAILGVLATVETLDWWRRVPPRTSRSRRQTGARALPGAAWFVVGGVLAFVVVRRILPPAEWAQIAAVIAGVVVGRIVEGRLTRRSDLRDGWAVLRGAGLERVADTDDLRFFDGPPLPEPPRTFAVFTSGVGFSYQQREAFGLPFDPPVSCLVVADPLRDEAWCVAVIGAISDALAALSLTSVVHAQWVSPRGTTSWSLERRETGPDLAIRLRDELILAHETSDVLIWSGEPEFGKVIAWRLAYGDLLERAVPGVTLDDELDAFAFFAAGDHRETFVAAMRDAARSVEV